MENLQLTHVTLKNFSAKTVAGVQLKWFISTKAEPEKVLPPPGYTGLFAARLQAGESQKVECPLIVFSRAATYLIKDGRLDGDFLLNVRVFQVEFEDGSSWNDDWRGPKPGERAKLGKDRPNDDRPMCCRRCQPLARIHCAVTTHRTHILSANQLLHIS